ncbi:MAG: AbrB/MazE/SpoVT family DNA-binding domain-containing protein [Candidatus Saccharibacteria bacterium]|nr:AbrB/MazE/SpoVT family DNA-binding domain-containing protein [Candidatus Saccharibacteria bacterium]
MKHDPPTLYGIATIGPKGQIVIPVDARNRLGVKPGDKIVIVGPAHKPQFVGLCSEHAFKSILEKIDTKLEDVKSAFEEQKGENQK